jgi:hypothetical protein
VDNNAQADFFLTLKEASKLSGLSLSTLRRAVKAGELITEARANVQYPVKVSRDGVLDLVRSKSNDEMDGEFGKYYSPYPARGYTFNFDEEPRESREELEAELAKSRDELEAVRGELDQLKVKAKKDELDLISLGDAHSFAEDEVAELRAERDALLKRAERAEGVAEGYRLGVDRTLEAFTDDLAKRLAEGVQVAQPVNNREQVVTYSNSEPVNNREQVRRRTLRERLFGR